MCEKLWRFQKYTKNSSSAPQKTHNRKIWFTAWLSDLAVSNFVTGKAYVCSVCVQKEFPKKPLHNEKTKKNWKKTKEKKMWRAGLELGSYVDFAFQRETAALQYWKSRSFFFLSRAHWNAWCSILQEFPFCYIATIPEVFTASFDFHRARAEKNGKFAVHFLVLPFKRPKIQIFSIFWCQIRIRRHFLSLRQVQNNIFEQAFQ